MSGVASSCCFISFGRGLLAVRARADSDGWPSSPRAGTLRLVRTIPHLWHLAPVISKEEIDLALDIFDTAIGRCVT
jgi:hypothetical protein